MKYILIMTAEDGVKFEMTGAGLAIRSGVSYGDHEPLIALIVAADDAKQATAAWIAWCDQEREPWQLVGLYPIGDGDLPSASDLDEMLLYWKRAVAERERAERAARRVTVEQREREELARLMEKYPDAAKGGKP